MTLFSVSAILKIAAFVLLLQLTTVTAGSCLNYGHSCWGGHGKRSPLLRHLFNPSNPEKEMDEWFISKLLKLSNEKQGGHSVVYNTRNTRSRDSDNVDKFGQRAYEEYPLSKLRDAVSGNQISQETNDDDGERGSSEGHEIGAESFFEPEDDDQVWNSKMHFYDKLRCH